MCGVVFRCFTFAKFARPCCVYLVIEQRSIQHHKIPCDDTIDHIEVEVLFRIRGFQGCGQERTRKPVYRRILGCRQMGKFSRIRVMASIHLQVAEVDHADVTPHGNTEVSRADIDRCCVDIHLRATREGQSPQPPPPAPRDTYV